MDELHLRLLRVGFTAGDDLGLVLSADGFGCRIVEAGNRMARLLVTTDITACEVDLLKEAIGPPATLSVGPVLAFDDAVGLKVRALHDRAAHRDYIDIHAANEHLSWPELEVLGARHTVGFSVAELADRLGAIDELDVETFASYGLTDEAIRQLIGWAARWEADIRIRLENGQTGPSGPPPEDEWDSYLDEP